MATRGTRRWLAASLLTAMVGASLPSIVFVAAPGASASTVPFTGGWLDSERGEFVGQGQQIAFASVTAIGTAAEPRFTLTNGTNHYEIDFEAPSGEATLSAGTYDNVGEIGANIGTGLSVMGDGRGCSVAFGRFTVDDASYDGAGHVLAFSARFEWHCNGSTPALFGFVSYNSAAMHRTRSMSTNTLTFAGSPGLSVSQTATLTNNGPDADTPTGFAIGGTDAANFAVTGTTCTTALAAGQSCTVTVGYVQPAPNVVSVATLTFTDELAPTGPANEPAGVGTGRRISLSGLSGVGTIAGVVTGAGGARLAGICVDEVSPTDTNSAGSIIATTGPDGSYVTGSLQPGTHELYFRPDANCGSGPVQRSYAPQIYNNAATLATALPIAVVGGQQTGGINVALVPAATVGGRVTNAAGAPLPQVTVAVVALGDVPWFQGIAITDSNGGYTVTGLAAGSYRVGFTYWPTPNVQEGQWFDGATNAAAATPVLVSASQFVGGINAVFPPPAGGGGSGGGGGGGGGSGGGGGGASSGTVNAGGTFASDPPATIPSSDDPVLVSLTSPTAGAVSITKTGSGASLVGFRNLGMGADISAPIASATHPLSLTFTADVADLPPGSYPADVTVFRDRVSIGACTGAPGVASPDPCITGSDVRGGVATFNVLSSHASSWDLEAATVGRLSGVDRFATAAATSRAEFPNGHARAVVLARGDDYPDALVGAPLARAKNAPLLLTAGAVLPGSTRAELERVLPAGGQVYVLGGTTAIPASVTAELAGLGYQVIRFAGADRYATAVAIADALGDPHTVLLASGITFPDALAAGPAAAHAGGVVLLTNGRQLPAATAAYLAAHGTAIYAVGGPAAQAEPSATAIVGADRYATASAVASRFFPAPPIVGIATGTAFPDALAGGALLASADAPLLLATPTELTTATSVYLTASKAVIGAVHLFGGESALSAAVARQATTLIE